MKILITGICGFVGSTLARSLQDLVAGAEILGIDNLSRPGADRNRALLQSQGVRIIHGDLRNASDLEGLAPVDWVIDCAANPSVLAGIDGKASSRQLVEHNLGGTVNLLEYCRRTGAGFILLSTSRVYSIPPLASLAVEVCDNAYTPGANASFPQGLSGEGVAEGFSTQAPVSLYGATKLASEQLALEYGHCFDLPVWINRCGVLAGAGQFGKADQGIFAFWLHSWREGRALRYIGFDGMGHQVRDCLHPKDVASLVALQMGAGLDRNRPPVVNVSGGQSSARSLAQLSAWCSAHWGAHAVGSNPDPRPFDLPWVVLDSSLARSTWNWEPAVTTDEILSEIAVFAEAQPDWISRCQ